MPSLNHSFITIVITSRIFNILTWFFFWFVQKCLIVENDVDSRNIAAAFNGSLAKTWPHIIKCNFFATTFDTGKIVDVHILTKFCYICSTSPSAQHICKKDYEGSSWGMEVAGVVSSFGDGGIRYTRYLGDGDFKAFQTVVHENTYGPNIEIQKLECIGHVEKRIGTRLRNMANENSGENLQMEKF